MTRITLETQGHILLIGLNRPEKLNAADEQMLHELSLAYGKLDTDHNLRVGLVFAHGDHFTAGLDLVDVGPALQSGGGLPLPEGGLDPWGISTHQVSKPVVIALKGTCFTLGVELALSSDVVIAHQDTVFAQLEVARGILPFGGRHYSDAKGRWLVTSHAVASHCRFFWRRSGTSDEYCHRGGGCRPPYPSARDRRTDSQQAPLAVQETLASARAALIDPVEEHRELTHRLGRLMATTDMQRGMQAFVTKQPASFEGN